MVEVTIEFYGGYITKGWVDRIDLNKFRNGRDSLLIHSHSHYSPKEEIHRNQQIERFIIEE